MLYLSKAQYSLFVLKVLLNPSQSIFVHMGPKELIQFIQGGLKYQTVFGTTKLRKKISVEKQTVCQNFQNYV